MKTLVFAGLLALALAAPAAAAETPANSLEIGVASLPAVQVTVPADVDNPSGLCFTPSIDNANIDSYEADLLSPGGSVLQVLNVGKPVADATNVACGAVNVQPVAFGVGYTFRLRARAGTAVSSATASLNKFNRVPGGPTKVFTK